MTHREVVVPGEYYRAPLPATGRVLSFQLPLGPTPPDDWNAQAIVELASRDGNPDILSVTVNDIAAEFDHAQRLENGNRLLTYSIPTAAVPGESRDTIRVTATGTGSITVLDVEVRIFPGDTP